ncbi:hypothetical protein A3860_36240 [Niastella vici]|uniref:Uncharacterized protein n=1 Tax=Niastella vici TaxID=1703345 RepID=A0A1V9FMZ2_9BACT|nr:hypothetical protein [Niastella vici]OQP59734.1 hypothetical protein A3860_36240 [Niastella vici]
MFEKLLRRYAVTGYRVPVTGYQLPGTSYRVPVTRCQLPGTSYQVPVTGYCFNCLCFFPGNRYLATGNW